MFYSLRLFHILPIQYFTFHAGYELFALLSVPFFNARRNFIRDALAALFSLMLPSLLLSSSLESLIQDLYRPTVI